MASFLTRSVQFLRELRRRRVIRNVLGYAALSLVLIEASGNILPPLGYSEDSVRIVIYACIVGLPIVVILSWVYDLTEGRLVRTGPNPSDRPADAEPVDEGGTGEPVDFDRRQLAVLPFDDLSGDESRYFADGVTDDLTSILAGIAELRVTSRTSVRTLHGRALTTRQIARQLQVGSILEGTVRRAGDRVRVAVRLVDTATDRPIWAETYDREMEDVLEIQGDVARRIAQALETELTERSRDRLDRMTSVAPAAYDAYLQGRFQWARRDEAGLEASVRELDRALEDQPAFALAQAALADSLITLGLYGVRRPSEVLPRARDAARRALDLDPDNGEAMAALACYRAIHRWEWAGAEEDFDRAVERSPSYATAYQWRAMHVHAPTARFEAARHDLGRAAELDPAAKAIRASEAFLSILEGRADEAEALTRAILHEEPGFSLARLFLGEALLLADRPAEACQALEGALTVRGRAPDILAALGRARAAAADEAGARSILDELVDTSRRRYVSPGRIGEVVAALADPDGALEWMGRAVEERAVDLIWLAVSPAWAPMRRRPEVVRVLERIGLSDAAL